MLTPTTGRPTLEPQARSLVTLPKPNKWHDEFALFVLIAIHNLIPRYFLTAGFRHALVIYRGYWFNATAKFNIGMLSTERSR
jgi:hypothetical protein